MSVSDVNKDRKQLNDSVLENDKIVHIDEFKADADETDVVGEEVVKEALVRVPRDSSLARPSTEHQDLARLQAQADQFPILSEKEESDLVDRFENHQDESAAQKLVLHHLRLVVSSVRRHKGYGLPVLDLAQEGVIGLMQAVKRYKPDMGVRVGIYAKPWVDGSIKAFVLHNWRLVKLGTGKVWKKLFFGYRSELARLEQLNPEKGQAALHAELAERMQVSPEHVARMNGYFQADSGMESEELQGVAALADQHTPQTILESSEHQQAQNQILLLVRELPERQRQILQARYLSEPPITLKDLADKNGISMERVRQIEKQALATLQTRARSAGLELALAEGL